MTLGFTNEWQPGDPTSIDGLPSRRKGMANRSWRIAANFHRVGDVVVTVEAMNWQGAIRKAALVIKKLPVMKGKRLNMGSFMLQEIEASPVQTEASEQLPLEINEQPAQRAQPETQVVETPLSTTVEPEE